MFRAGCAVAAIGTLLGCTTESDSAPPAPTESSTSTSVIDQFDLDAWSAQRQEQFADTTSAMTNFAEAVEAGEVDQAAEAAAQARTLMAELAAELDGETDQDAIDLRIELVECSRAYGAVEEALTNVDPEAFEAAAPLFRRCLGISNVQPPTT